MNTLNIVNKLTKEEERKNRYITAGTSRIVRRIKSNKYALSGEKQCADCAFILKKIDRALQGLPAEYVTGIVQESIGKLGMWCEEYAMRLLVMDVSKKYSKEIDIIHCNQTTWDIEINFAHTEGGHKSVK